MLSACPSACLDSAPSTSGRHGQTTTHQAVQFSSHPSRTAAFSSQIRHSTHRANRGQLQTLCAIKKKSEKNLVCSKTLTIKPEHKDQVLDMCRQVVTFSKEKMQSKKSGILAFECSEDNYEPLVVHFWERYDGNRSMGLHNTTDEYSSFMQKVQQHLEGPIGMALYEWQDGQIGMACVHGGPKGEGGLDDATGAGGAGGASMKQSSAVVDLGDVQRNEGKEAWGMGINFKFPWQKKKEKEDKERAAAEAKK
ncbi:hypothetical protein ABBQ32_000187 [Trebouxia sp. C0010 RCD-2024]